MKKTVSVVYTIVVVVILLAIVAYFGWDAYQTRAERIADFENRTEEYTGKLADSLTANRDVDTEVAIAERLMASDPSLIAVQVFSHDDGLRLSVVKSRAGDYSRKPLADSGEFDGFFARLRYHVVVRPMGIPEMAGLEALYVSATLSSGEIRSNLLIILITVVGLFIITLVLILVRPGSTGSFEEDDHGEDFHEDPGTPAPSLAEDDDFSLPDFDDPAGSSADDLAMDDLAVDDLAVEDLAFDDSTFSESIDLDLDEDFSLPDFDEGSGDSIPAAAGAGSPMMKRLESELERAASFNQDLAFLVFDPDDAAVDLIRDSFNYEDLLFDLGDGRVAAIEINKDLDTALAFVEDFVRDLISRLGNRRTRVGIASRNGRLISADRLVGEAMGALNRTDGTKNIVAFRSDPEKYREYLRSQES